MKKSGSPAWRRGPARIERLEVRRHLDAARVNDIIAGPTSSVSLTPSVIKYTAALGDKLIFPAIDSAHGQELWVSDGTAGDGVTTGTHMLADIVQGTGSSNPNDFVAGGGYVFFTTNEGLGSINDVWRTDGTVVGTVRLTSLPADAGSAALLTYANGTLYFFTFAEGGVTTGLWKTNGTTGGQTRIGDAPNGSIVGTLGSNLLFSASDEDHGQELWFSDGTSETILTDIFLGTSGSNPGAGVTYNNRVYFAATDASGGIEPWVSNGNGAFTNRFANIAPGFSSSDPQDFTVSGGYLYFVANNSTGTPNYQIYRTDGANFGAVTALPGVSGGGNIRDLTDFNGTLYFTYNASGQLRQLYKLVPKQGAQLVGDGGNSPGYLTPVGSTLFFNGVDSGGKSRLYETDGTTITQVGGDPGTDPVGLTNVNGTLFYQGEDDAHGAELHIASAAEAPPNPDDFHVKLSVSADEINEGESVTFTAKVIGGATGAKYKYRWDFDGDGTLVASGYKPTHRYGDNLPDNAARDVRVKVIAADGTFKVGHVSVTVLNVAPTVKVSMPGQWVPYAPMQYTVSVSDPGDSEKLNVQVDWGKGNVDRFDLPGNMSVSSFHIFTQRNVFGADCTITVRDKDGGKTVKHKSVLVFDAEAASAAAGIASTLIGGTSGNDKIEVKKHNGPLKDATTQLLDVIINDQTEVVNVNTGLAGFTGNISIYGGGGNDQITVDLPLFDNITPTQTNIVQVFGGDGNDRINFVVPNISTDNAPVEVFGGAGNDTLYGTPGHDLLVGGPGSDHFVGTSKKDKVTQ